MNLNKINIISVIIPSYNEEKNIKLLFDDITSVLKELVSNSKLELIFVDDGSKDSTLLEIKKLAEQNSFVKYLSFSRNFGHQKALMAGLNAAKGNCVISMDADMQHPAKIIPQLIEEWEKGNDIVYTIRKDKKLPFLKRLSSSLFYKIINKLSDVEIEKGTADFRLLDQKVVTELKKMNEMHIFYRGLIPWVGFKSMGIEYQAEDRVYGRSKYTFRKMMSFAIDGITSFSTKPLRLSIYLGIMVALLAFIYGIFVIFVSLFTNLTISGWSSTITVILFIGGIQLIILGIIGEYIGKLYMENKNRPNFIIKDSNI